MRNILIGLIAALSMGGCLERSEHLRFGSRGELDVHIEYKSDSHGELYEGDAVPSIRGGWLIEERVEVKEGRTRGHEVQKEEITLIADGVFPAGKLPSTFAVGETPGDPVAIQFPTTARIEQRGGGNVLHVRRVYSARPWAAIERLRGRLKEVSDSLQEKDFETWTAQERQSMAQAVIDFELEKVVHFARQAFNDLWPDKHQDAFLAARAAVLALREELDLSKIDRVLQEMQTNPDPDQHENPDQPPRLLQAQLDAIIDSARQRMRQALRDHGGPVAAGVQAFEQRWDHRRRIHQITEDLADDAFEIKIEMPGPIIASNADEVNDRIAKWRFKGDEIRDCEKELLVSSHIGP